MSDLRLLELDSERMGNLYERIQLLEPTLTPAYIRRSILPSWWNDDVGAQDTGFGHAVLIIAEHLGLDPASLWDINAAVKYRGTSHRMWRHNEIREADVSAALHIAESVARVVLGVIHKSRRNLEKSADEIRAALCHKSPAGVSFTSVLRYCWECGIPVLHLSGFPNEIKKMVGAALAVDGRHAIILTSRKFSPEWHLFPLVHELGHITLGHLGQNGGIVETAQLMGFSEQGDNSDERMVGAEREANTFAHRVLTGYDHVTLHPDYEYNPNAHKLVLRSREISRESLVDLGYTIICYGRETGRWSVVQSALNEIGREQGESTLRRFALKYLDLARLDDDSHEYVTRMMGIS